VEQDGFEFCGMAVGVNNRMVQLRPDDSRTRFAGRLHWYASMKLMHTPDHPAINVVRNFKSIKLCHAWCGVPQISPVVQSRRLLRKTLRSARCRESFTPDGSHIPFNRSEKKRYEVQRRNTDSIPGVMSYLFDCRPGPRHRATWRGRSIPLLLCGRNSYMG